MGIDGLRVDARRVRTNIVIVELQSPDGDAATLISALREQGVRCFSLGKGLRMVMHRNIDDADVEYTLAACRRAMGATIESARPGRSGPY